MLFNILTHFRRSMWKQVGNTEILVQKKKKEGKLSTGLGASAIRLRARYEHLSFLHVRSDSRRGLGSVSLCLSTGQRLKIHTCLRVDIPPMNKMNLNCQFHKLAVRDHTAVIFRKHSNNTI